jgi:hypothetical protein
MGGDRAVFSIVSAGWFDVFFFLFFFFFFFLLDLESKNLVETLFFSFFPWPTWDIVVYPRRVSIREVIFICFRGVASRRTNPFVCVCFCLPLIDLTVWTDESFRCQDNRLKCYLTFFAPPPPMKRLTTTAMQEDEIAKRSMQLNNTRFLLDRLKLVYASNKGSSKLSFSSPLISPSLIY